MKRTVATLATWITIIGLAVPATAQRANFPRIPIIRSESQDFFHQGREQFEKEIRFLVWSANFPTENPLKIDELPPLEDGPFSVERSSLFSNWASSSDIRACSLSSRRYRTRKSVCQRID